MKIHQQLAEMRQRIAAAHPEVTYITAMYCVSDMSPSYHISAFVPGLAKMLHSHASGMDPTPDGACIRFTEHVMKLRSASDAITGAGLEVHQ